MDLPHDGANAMLSYIAYDEYVSVDEDGLREISFDAGITLEEFKTIYELVKTSEAYAEEDDLLVLPGEADFFHNYEITAEVTKKIARTLLKCLRTNELNSICFSMFDASNLRLSRSGRVKLKNVKILRNLSADELSQGLTDNYMSAYEIINEGLFSGFPPPDVAHLLDLIKGNIKREIYHIHGSLVPLATYPALLKAMYDHITSVLPYDDFHAILKKLPYVDDWQDLVKTNKLLLMTFEFNANSYDVPGDKPKQLCLNKDQKAVLASLGMHQAKKQKTLTAEQIDLIKAFRFFGFLRNRTSHRMEPFRDWVAGGDQNYSAEGSEVVSHLKFPLVLPIIQEALFDLGRLFEIPIESFF